MTDRNTLRRTGLYVSASSPVNMAQAPFYNEDMLIYDLEDSVPKSEKDAARLLIYHTVKYHRPKDKEVVIRVNGIDTCLLYTSGEKTMIDDAYDIRENKKGNIG